MKRWVAVLALVVAMGVGAPALHAQAESSGSLDHVEFGAFAEFYRLSTIESDFGGLGGRFAANVGSPYVQLEAEMGYDFEQAFTEHFSNGETVGFAESHTAVLHGLFGPKFQTRGRFKVFGTVKGGFINFRLTPEAASFNSFTSNVGSLRTSNVDATFYPGGGVETFVGPVGLRLEAGDEMYFVRGGVHNNLKISFGPTFRF